MTAAEPPSIVVGVDGSDGSHDALRWAAGQAQLTAPPLRVVASWRWPNYVTRVPPGADLAAETARTLRRDGRRPCATTSPTWTSASTSSRDRPGRRC